MLHRRLPSFLIALASAIFCVTAQAQQARPAGGFVGSAACKDCHRSQYDRWQKTLMANVVVDPKAHPEVVVGDFKKPNELVTFKLRDVAFVYGSKWKQRYFYKRGDDYFVYPVQWDVKNKVWRPYVVAKNTDWWLEHYPDPTAKADGAALRRLPLHELRRQDQAGHGVERGL